MLKGELEKSTRLRLSVYQSIILKDSLLPKILTGGSSVSISWPNRVWYGIMVWFGLA
jgi:hypothetical protein